MTETTRKKGYTPTLRLTGDTREYVLPRRDVTDRIILRTSPLPEGGDPYESVRQLARLFAPGGRYDAVAVGPSGKPFFPQMPGVHFSLSHSGSCLVCAVSDQPLGIDLERHKSRDFLALARRFFTKEEAALLECASFPGGQMASGAVPDPCSDPAQALRPTDAAPFDLTAGFYRLWTAKESYVKFLGGGVPGDLKAFSLLPVPAHEEDPGELLSDRQSGFFGPLEGPALCFRVAAPIEASVYSLPVPAGFSLSLCI